MPSLRPELPATVIRADLDAGLATIRINLFDVLEKGMTVTITADGIECQVPDPDGTPRRIQIPVVD
jgi:hypothetical protein